jgi:hypothetical protein
METYYTQLARRFEKESKRFKRRNAFIHGIERILKKSLDLFPIIIRDVRTRDPTQGFHDYGFYHVVIGKYQGQAYFYGGGGPNEPPLWLRYFSNATALERIYEFWPKKPIEVLLDSLRCDDSDEPAKTVFNGIVKDFRTSQGMHGAL